MTPVSCAWLRCAAALDTHDAAERRRLQPVRDCREGNGVRAVETFACRARHRPVPERQLFSIRFLTHENSTHRRKDMRIRNIILATMGALTLAGCAYDRYGYGDDYGRHHHHHRDRDGYYVGGDYHPR